MTTNGNHLFIWSIMIGYDALIYHVFSQVIRITPKLLPSQYSEKSELDTFSEV